MCDSVVAESPAGLFFYCLTILTFCEGRGLKSSLLVGGNCCELMICLNHLGRKDRDGIKAYLERYMDVMRKKKCA